MNETQTELLDQLFFEAIRADRNLRSRDEIERLLADPDASPPSRVHDWRNHLPEIVAENWAALATEARLVAFIAAAQLAHAEQWD